MLFFEEKTAEGGGKWCFWKGEMFPEWYYNGITLVASQSEKGREKGGKSVGKWVEGEKNAEKIVKNAEFVWWFQKKFVPLRSEMKNKLTIWQKKYRR